MNFSIRCTVKLFAPEEMNQMKWTTLQAVARLLARNGRWDEIEKILSKELEETQEAPAVAYYLLGNAKFKLEKYAESSEWTAKAINLDPNKAIWHFRMGALHERAQRFEQAAKSFSRAIELNPSNSYWHLRLSYVLTSSRRIDDAAAALANAQDLEPESIEIAQKSIAHALRHGTTWQKIDALKAGLRLDSRNLSWVRSLANCEMELGQFEKAADVYQRALEIDPNSADTWFNLGDAQYRNKQLLAAENTFSRLSPADQKYGPGIQYEKRGLWESAAFWYERKAKLSGGNPELWFKAGFAYERSYNWERSIESYRNAVSIKPNDSIWHYRLGFSLERSKKWKEASEAYEHAIRRNPKLVPNWQYRCGYVLTRAGQKKKALEFYSSMFEKHLEPNRLLSFVSDDGQVLIRDPSEYELQTLSHGLNIARESKSYDQFLTIARSAVDLGQLNVAKTAYKLAVMHDNDDRPRTWFELALVLTLLEQTDEALIAFENTKVFGRPDGISTDRYFKHAATRESMEYAEYLATRPISRNVVLYESYLGSKIDCNPYAIYRSVLADPDYGHLTHVWVVTPGTYIPDVVRNEPNTVIVERSSRLYRRYLATARYLVNNVSFPHYFTRREGQEYLNTWHGTPLKTLGRDVKSGFMEYGNVTRNFLQATHLLTPNDHTYNCLVDRYDIAGVYSGKVAALGSPRVDQMIHPDLETLKSTMRSLGLASNRKVVFYAPTWRGDSSVKHFDKKKLVDDLKSLSALNAQILFRAHHMTEKLLSGVDIPVTVVPNYVDTYEVLSVTDVLITDYSSIFFDFLPKKKPIVLYAYDKEEYESERGLYFDLNDMPVVTASTIKELVSSVELSLSSGIQDIEKHQLGIDTFASLEDGYASRRTIDFFFGESDEFIVRADNAEKKSILFHQSLLPNGISSSFINLVNELDPSKYRIVFVFDPSSILNDEARKANFLKLPDHVQLIPRVGGHLVTLEERWVIEQYNKVRHFSANEQETIYRGAFEREFTRIFGSCEFNAIVEFDGYTTFWASILSAKESSAKNRLIYMHSQMYKEWSTKYGTLEPLFRLYEWFTKVVSVSEHLCETNRSEIAGRFNIAPNIFDFCENMMQYEKIKSLASESLDPDIEEFFSGAHEKWITIGRMSPEKAHIKLVTAFSKHLVQQPGSKLLVLGDGPLRSQIESKIRSLGISSSVMLAGHRSNPFAPLSRADALVLASDHEGQPMVLLESLMLRIPVLATDIVGSRGVLKENLGLLVENSVEGLADGFSKVLVMESSRTEDFDAHAYQSSALDRFIGLAFE